MKISIKKRLLLLFLITSLIGSVFANKSSKEQLLIYNNVYCKVIADIKSHVGDTILIHLKAVWLNNHFEQVINTSNKVVLYPDNFTYQSPYSILVPDFLTNSYIAFNREYALKVITERTDQATEIWFGLNFGIKGLEGNNHNQLAIKKPQKISLTHQIQPLTKKNNAAKGQDVIFVSHTLNANGIIESNKNNIELIGKVSDYDNLNAIIINSEQANLFPDGVFKKQMTLNPGLNDLQIMVVDNNGKIQSFDYKINCSDYSSAHQLIKAGKYYALFIAIEDYLDPQINALDNTIKDAEILYNTLTSHYTFNEEDAEILVNPTRSDLIIAMDQLSRKVTENDNLLIFYAGHGYWSESSGQGFWLPSDASKNNTVNWIRNSTVRDYIEAIQSKHTLLISDACFSGGIFKTRGAFTNNSVAVEKLYKLPSRKAMTSGTIEEVPDQSVFLKYLNKRLIENKDAYLPSETLFSMLKVAVLNNSPNIPQYGEIANTGDEGGDFIFIRRY